MPGAGPKSFPCILCNKRTKPLNRRPVHSNKRYAAFLQQTYLLEVNHGAVSCSKCYRKYYRSSITPSDTKNGNYTTNKAFNNNPSHPEDHDPTYQPAKKQKTTHTIQSPTNISLPIPASGNSHSTCFVCKRRSPKLVNVSVESHYRLFVEKGRLLISGTRCCPNHLTSDGYFSVEARSMIQDADNAISHFNRTDIINLIDHVRSIAIRNEQKRIDFDNPDSLSDADYLSLTGLTKNDFEDLCQYVTSVKHEDTSF